MSQSLDRALQLLDELAAGERGLDELAAAVGVHKTTVLRLLRTLEERRYVRHDERHRYRLGPQLFAMADRSVEQHAVRDAAAPHLRALSRATGGQTVHLAVLDDASAVYVDKVEGTHAVRMVSRVGLAAPLHCTAVGKVLLAGLPVSRRAALVGVLELERRTDATLTDPDELLDAIEAIAAQGFATDDGEHEAFVNCVAAPVRGAAGRVVAAISVSVPQVLLTREQVHELVPALLATTAAVTAAYE